jgi:hypothetical protein
MKKYFNQKLSSEQVLSDLNSTQWVADFGGCRFEQFAFFNWFDGFYKEETTIKYFKDQLKSKVIPVYIIDLPYISDLKYSKIKPCTGEGLQLPFEVSSRSSLNITFIEPLNSKFATDFLNFKDTMNRKKYLEYVKFHCH